jgi:hypothetical protein
MTLRANIIGAALCGAVLLGNACSDGPNEVEGCVQLVADADHQDAVDRQVLENLSYNGNIWWHDNGHIFGYSEYEDSAIWNKDGCL